MAIIEQTNDTAQRQRIAWIALGVILVGVVVLLCFALRRPPQMGVDRDVFRTVDALYTAVRMQDSTRLAQCEQRLNAYRDGGKLPQEASEYLEGVIAKAHAGKWESAAERLYEFMKVQRREE